MKTASCFIILCLFSITSCGNPARETASAKSEVKGVAQMAGISSLGEAVSALYKKDYSQALKNAEAAEQAMGDDPVVLFVLAEARAAKGDTPGALETLDRALKTGFDNTALLMTDTHLTGLRETKGFRDLMTKYKVSLKDANKRERQGAQEDVVRAGNVEIRVK